MSRCPVPADCTPSFAVCPPWGAGSLSRPCPGPALHLGVGAPAADGERRAVAGTFDSLPLTFPLFLTCLSLGGGGGDAAREGGGRREARVPPPPPPPGLALPAWLAELHFRLAGKGRLPWPLVERCSREAWAPGVLSRSTRGTGAPEGGTTGSLVLEASFGGPRPRGEGGTVSVPFSLDLCNSCGPHLPLGKCGHGSLPSRGLCLGLVSSQHPEPRSLSVASLPSRSPGAVRGPGIGWWRCPCRGPRSLTGSRKQPERVLVELNSRKCPLAQRELAVQSGQPRTRGWAAPERGTGRCTPRLLWSVLPCPALSAHGEPLASRLSLRTAPHQHAPPL